MQPVLLSERKLVSESVLEEQRTVEALRDLNAEINMVLNAKLAEIGVNRKEIRYGDLEMFRNQDNRCFDFFYKRKCLLQVRTEPRTDGGVSFNLFYEPIKACGNDAAN